jgi:two-component system, chemotaxis family, response regulator Rcp1
MALPKVLVIEDNPADIQLLRTMLAKALGPHHFDVLQDGESALAFIRTHPNTPNADPCVIVLDLQLPRHHGVAVLEELRRTPELTHIKVVVISSFASPDELEQVEKLGGLFREKPSHLNAFEELAVFIADVCRDAPLPAMSRAGVQ